MTMGAIRKILGQKSKYDERAFLTLTLQKYQLSKAMRSLYIIISQIQSAD